MFAPHGPDEGCVECDRSRSEDVESPNGNLWLGIVIGLGLTVVLGVILGLGWFAATRIGI